MSAWYSEFRRFNLGVHDRHFGVGGDGLVLISPSETADFDMDMYNADGSRSGMCGNAIRCVGKYVYDRGLTDKKVITVSTQTGVKTLWLDVCDGAVQTVRVCMGKPDFRPEAVPAAAENVSRTVRTIRTAGTVSSARIRRAVSAWADVTDSSIIPLPCLIP